MSIRGTLPVRTAPYGATDIEDRLDAADLFAWAREQVAVDGMSFQSIADCTAGRMADELAAVLNNPKNIDVLNRDVRQWLKEYAARGTES